MSSPVSFRQFDKQIFKAQRLDRKAIRFFYIRNISHEPLFHAAVTAKDQDLSLLAELLGPQHVRVWDGVDSHQEY